jgi:hypothetical protein
MDAIPFDHFIKIVEQLLWFPPFFSWSDGNEWSKI